MEGHGDLKLFACLNQKVGGWDRSVPGATWAFRPWSRSAHASPTSLASIRWRISDALCTVLCRLRPPELSILAAG